MRKYICSKSFLFLLFYLGICLFYKCGLWLNLSEIFLIIDQSCFHFILAVIQYIALILAAYTAKEEKIQTGFLVFSILMVYFMLFMDVPDKERFNPLTWIVCKVLHFFDSSGLFLGLTSADSVSDMKKIMLWANVKSLLPYAGYFIVGLVSASRCAGKQIIRTNRLLVIVLAFSVCHLHVSYVYFEAIPKVMASILFLVLWVNVMCRYRKNRMVMKWISYISGFVLIIYFATFIVGKLRDGVPLVLGFGSYGNIWAGVSEEFFLIGPFIYEHQDMFPIFSASYGTNVYEFVGVAFLFLIAVCFRGYGAWELKTLKNVGDCE